MDVGIGRDGGAHIDADRCGVDQFDLSDTRCVYRPDMFRQVFSMDKGRECRHKAFQNQRGFAGAGNAGHDGQFAFWNIDFSGFDGMDSCCRKVKFSGREEGGHVRLAHVDTVFSGKEGSYPRNGIVGDVGDFSLCNDMAA